MTLPNDTAIPDRQATLARIRATLRAALNAAICKGLISGNPARCDIDFAGTTLTVGRQLQETSRGLVLPPKSIAGNRVLASIPGPCRSSPPTAAGSICPRGAAGTSSPSRAAVPARPGT